MPLISILEPEKAADDIREYAKLGFKAAQIPYAIKDGGYFDAAYEPIWTAADETGVVLHIHLGGPARAPRRAGLALIA